MDKDLKKYEVWYRGALELATDNYTHACRVLRYFGGRSYILFTESGIKEYEQA